MGKSMKKENKESEKPVARANAPAKKKKGIKGIIRLAGSDMFGETPLNMAVMKVRGFGHTCGLALSRVVAKQLNVPVNIHVGDLNESQVSQMGEILENANNYLPTYLLNRRKDPWEGKDKHLIANDLIFANRQDVEKEKNVYSWKGYRHAYGQKVRGQRTKNTGRQGRAVGVLKKSLIPQKGAAPVAGAPAPAAAGKPAAPGKKEEKK